MRKSQQHIMLDMEQIHDDDFISFCRNGNASAFTRTRKMPLEDLLQTMINRKGLTLTLEIRNYMNAAHPGEQISKPGYLKQRMKLNPDAFLELYRYHNKNFYADSDYRTYNGWLVLAADGSGINVPTTPETLEAFGSSSRNGTKPRAQLGLGCLYDVMNRMILESDCHRVKFNEMRTAEKQIDRVRATIGEEQPFLVVMDRGYPSTPAFIHMIDKGIYFLVRLKTSDYKKEQSGMNRDDMQVEIALDRTRIHHYKGTPDGDRMEELGKITLRMVRVKLDHGCWEVLATNLPETLFSEEDIAALYRLRWKIETAYETLKSRLQIENFTGTKPLLLKQDIYSTIYVSNLAEEIILEVEQELDEEDHSYKHKMAVNQTIGIGMLKNDLIYIFLEKDAAEKDRLFQKLYNDISKNLVPIRPDRHYKRTKGQLAGKYSNTHKRAF